MERKIAIKGDNERGLEVIMALEEMGGLNECRYMGNNDNMYFHLIGIDKKQISYSSVDENLKQHFTLYTIDQYIKTFGPLKQSQQEIEKLYLINKECNTFYTCLNDVDWFWISRNKRLSEEFVREFKDHLYWDYISENILLSENIIREMKDYVNWENISKYQQLSEDFIREFKDVVDWDYIFEYQNISLKFRSEFKNKIHTQKQNNDINFNVDFDEVDFEEFLQLFNI